MTKMDLSGVPLEKLVERFAALRDRKKAMEVEQKKALEPIEKAMETLEFFMLKHLNDAGATSSKTAHGTAYIYKHKTGTIVDFDALWEHVRENDMPEVFQRRLSLSEVDAYNETHPDTPVPGVQIETTRTVRVRKS